MNTQDPIKKLRSLSPDEINQLDARIYSDFDIGFAMGPGNQDDEIDLQKQFALLSLMMHSPQITDFFDYGDMLFDLLNQEVTENQGKNLLYWALFAITYYAKNAPELMNDVEYFFYCRGLIYEGHYESFLKVLRLILDQAPLSKPKFESLLEDFNRFNQVKLVQKLDQVGQKKFGNDWDLDLEQITISRDGSNIPNHIQSQIINLLNEDRLVLEDDFTDFHSLFSYEEVSEHIKSAQAGEVYLPVVPDMIRTLFANWDEDRSTSYDILGILKGLSNNILPELSFFGELLDFESKTVYLSDTFGKTQGFSLASLKQILSEDRLSSHYRGFAGRMMMDVAQNNPDVRAEIVDFLASIIANPPSDTLEYESLVTFLVADVLDFDLYELKGAIVKAFNENRVDPMSVGPDSFDGKWSLRGLNSAQVNHENSILLRCKSCNRTRKFDYDYLLLDVDHYNKEGGSASHSLFINRTVQCNRCGAVDNYEIGTPSMLRILPALMPIDGKINLIEGVNDNIFFIISVVLRDLSFERMSFESIRQKIIAGNTKKLDPLFLGEYYRTIGWFKEALETFKLAYKEQPDNRKVLLMLACAEHDFGDREKAKTHYQKVLSLAKGDIFLSVSDSTSQNALHGLTKLKEGLPSPLPYPKNIEGRDLLDYLNSIKKRKKRRH